MTFHVLSKKFMETGLEPVCEQQVSLRWVKGNKHLKSRSSRREKVGLTIQEVQTHVVRSHISPKGFKWSTESLQTCSHSYRPGLHLSFIQHFKDDLYTQSSIVWTKSAIWVDWVNIKRYSSALLICLFSLLWPHRVPSPESVLKCLMYHVLLYESYSAAVKVCLCTVCTDWRCRCWIGHIYRGRKKEPLRWWTQNIQAAARTRSNRVQWLQ